MDNMIIMKSFQRGKFLEHIFVVVSVPEVDGVVDRMMNPQVILTGIGVIELLALLCLLRCLPLANLRQ